MSAVLSTMFDVLRAVERGDDTEHIPVLLVSRTTLRQVSRLKYLYSGFDFSRML